MTQALTINDVWIKPGRITLGTYGSVGVDRLAFVFSGEWEGLLTKATFYPVYGSPVEMLASGEVVVPPEMYKQSGVGKLVISGYAIENNVLKKRKYTLPCEMEIPNTIVRKGENSVPETPGVYEQLRAQMQDDITNALQAAKDSGAFDGADGEAATVAVSRTVTLPSGSDASVSNEGTNTNARLVFGIPLGAKGDSGERGASGVYVLADGETESDIPTDAEVALFPSGEDLHILDGRGIVSITRTTGNGAAGSTDIYTIAYSDTTTSTFSVYNGKDGAAGAKGDTGATGAKGEDGRGIVSITRTSGNGAAGTVDTYTIAYSDSTTSTFTVRNGADGTAAGITIDGTVTSTGTNAVSGKAVYDHVLSVMGDFNTVASQMETLIGG